MKFQMINLLGKIPQNFTENYLYPSMYSFPCMKTKIKTVTKYLKGICYSENICLWLH